jgi:signal transduction histidine kinase
VALDIASVLLAKTLESSTFRQALIFIGIFGAVVIALFSFVYWSTASYVRGRSDDMIVSEVASLKSAFAAGGRSAVSDLIARRIDDSHFNDSLYLLADASYAPIAGNLQAWPPVLRRGSGWGGFTAGEPARDAAHRRPLRALADTLADGTHVLVGKDIENLDQFVTNIRIALGLCLSLMFVIATAVGLSVTLRTVGRIEAINATSRAIMQTGLDRRIPLRGTHDEWDELAENLNSMLSRIEALMSEVRQFSDNVAHDLRTPLARIRGRLEKAYYDRHPSDRSLISDTIADLDGVLAMFSSLLRISQIEAHHRTAAFRTIDLAEIVREVVELFDAAAEEKGLCLDSVGGSCIMINGDRDLLFDALSNLVDNAIKYGRQGGRVTLDTTMNGGAATISVVDDGPGIPVDQRQHVFKRFYRLERSRATSGYGLGLSLVEAVARLHGATIEMVDKQPGLEIRLVFPAVSMPLAASPAAY